MSKVEDFLSKAEEQRIVTAIQTAEQRTSGEIRVHLEASTESKDAYLRAQEIFQMLEMHKTDAHNGVLIYVAVEDKKFVIFGDEGINKVVENDFWNTTKDIMQKQFKEGNYAQGIIDGILKAGDELKVHFPWQIDDKNELTNEISKG